MFGSEVLDVALGVLFVYLTLSLICSAIQEAIAALLRLRPQYLYRGLRILLDDHQGSGLARDFFNHPLIDTLFPGKYQPSLYHNLPSYIPPRSFALAIMDLAAPRSQSGEASGAGVTPQRLRDSLAGGSVLPAKVTQALLTLADAAAGDAVALRQNVEQWYNSAMDRVSSAYKRRTQAIILTVGFIVVAAVNADSIGIVSALSTNKAVRDSLVATATRVSWSAAAQGNPPAAGDPKELSQFAACQADATSADCRLQVNLNRIRDSGLPIGWVRHPLPGDLRGIPASPWLWFQKAIGILLTIAAVSLGAPFWFDALSKIVVIRSAVKPAQSAPAP